MREADSAAVDARTAGTVERLVDQGWQGGRWSWQVGTGGSRRRGSDGRNLKWRGVRKMNMSGGGRRGGRGSEDGGGGDGCGVAGAPVSPWE